MRAKLRATLHVALCLLLFPMIAYSEVWGKQLHREIRYDHH